MDNSVVNTNMPRRAMLRRSLAATAMGGASLLGAGCAGGATSLSGSIGQSRNGVELTLLGTAAGPPIHPGRTGISSVLSVHGQTYVIDCGRSSATQYKNAELEFRDLRSIFLTHLHADHVCDYYNFFLLAGFGPNDAAEGDGILSPVSVFGPGPAGRLSRSGTAEQAPTIAPEDPTPGLAELTEHSHHAFAYSSNVFLRDTGITDIRSLIDLHEISLPPVGADPIHRPAPTMKPFTVTEDDRVSVSAVLVPHGPVFPSFAFRFDTDRGSIVFSGDTAASDNVVELATGADVLVHEALDIDWYKENGTPEHKISHLTQSHTPAGTVGSIARKAGVGTLVLSHLAPAPPSSVSDARWRQQAQRGFDGRVLIGNDLDRIPVG
ncbi:MBL fold metallo-hydrolase [Haloactinomyces albus]|uniref:Ribonuclease BN (tRNA processing enzyme) n=1 Tax=Haloactinomyces albus TaxID=1352928 RepID=A0AAE4CRW0_9ACTN|nr:MBL fold metallo-hydrolase [Haloactinomyces albus]MDR7304093.1 ribonuclease BN (tRNA processing enzyme) [Haloactinomyces albus]